jgi:peptidoglycan/xylan/chitin deacetylase (PgdA/CDA1 family)
MKIIISHDIDHLNVSEHFCDLIIPKFIVRSKIELLTGKISFGEFFNRIGELFSNKWNKIEELIEFNKQHQIPATFFVGVNNGLGLNYSVDKAAIAIKYIQSQGCEVGVHGISFDNIEAVQKEFDTFEKIIGHKEFGIRMHYLRNNPNTLNYLSQAGYLFDATLPELKSSFSIANFTEFPVHIMDGWMMNKQKAWQANNLQQAIDESKRLIDEGLKSNIDYFSILFHDRYFSNGFKTWKEWYIQLIEYLIHNNFEFVDYKMAISERKKNL